MMKVRCIFPLGFCMAIAALFAQLALVRVVVEMTRRAFSTGRDIEDCFDMTISTSDLLVRASQHECCGSKVVEKRLAPVLAGVTAAAIGSPMAAVIVIFKVATGTCCVHDIVKRVFAVAVVASKCRVLTLKREVSIVGVVETRIFPRARVVAAFALFAASSLVRVVLGVTTEATCWRILMRLILVAVGAFRLKMFANQREVRCVVVKLHVGPVARTVTINAFASKEAVVRVVVEMTINTVTRCVAMFDIRLVAIDAFNFKVLAQQFEVCKDMIEYCFIKTQDVRAATLMICVACGTRTICNIAGHAVKTCAVVYIKHNVLVAIETQLILPRSFKRNMAGRALGLYVRVPEDDFARHHERLNGLSSNSVTYEAGEQRNKSL